MNRLVLTLSIALLSWPSGLAAQDSEPPSGSTPSGEAEPRADGAAPADRPSRAPGTTHVTPPPPPDQRQAELLIDVRLGAVIPIERTDICPGDSFCVLNGGGSVSFMAGWRWPTGIGVLLAFDAWFVDSGGVFELGTFKVIRAALSYVFDDSSMVHPVIHLGGGFLWFGETLFVSTVGGAVELGTTLEIELTDSVAFTVGAQGWLFSTTPFTTGRDGTMRSGGLNAALQLNVGLSILASSGLL